MSDGPHNSFVDELKRRNVFRVAAAYLVVAWVIIQIVDTVFPRLGVSERVITLVIVVLGIGVIPVVVLAWIYEMTPSGIKRDEDVLETRSRSGMRAFDYVVAVALTAIVVVYFAGRFSGPAVDDGKPAATGAPSIAVLPFENRSANPDDVFFVDGVHDDILSSLAKIGSMKVISRTSVEQFKDTQRTVPEIGDMLGVSSILEGGVQRAGDRIRINVQLIDAATDEHLWANTYDRELTAENIFAIQSEMSGVIANELHAALTPQELSRLGVVPTQNLRAYEAYMLGSQRLQRRSESSINEAIEYFQTAVTHDDGFALAYVGLADSYSLIYTNADRRREDFEPLAREAVTRALEIDPSLGEAYASLGMIEMESGNFELAEQHYQSAIALSPNYASAYQWYGEMLGSTDRPQESLEQLKIAISIDPLSPIINYIMGRRQISSGMLDEGEASFKKAIEIDPDFGRGYEGLALIQFQNSLRLDEAAMAQRHAIRLGASSPANFALMSNILISIGDTEGAQEWIDEAIARDPDNPNVMFVSATLMLFKNGVTAAASTARRALDAYPRAWFFASIVVLDHLMRDDLEGARAVVGREYPELFATEGPLVDRTNYGIATLLAVIERRAGNRELAARLVDAAEEASESSPSNRGHGKTVFEMSVAALRGQDEAAIEMLRQLAESGWSFFAFYNFDYNPAFDSIRSRADFQEIREVWQANLAEQRESLAAKWTEAGFE